MPVEVVLAVSAALVAPSDSPGICQAGDHGTRVEFSLPPERCTVLTA